MAAAQPLKTTLDSVFPACMDALGPARRADAVAACAQERGPERFPEVLARQARSQGLPSFLADLARLELTVFSTAEGAAVFPDSPEKIILNPTLSLLQCSWRHLVPLLHQSSRPHAPRPERGEEYVLVWKHPTGELVHVRPASSEDLLVLKIIAEGVDPRNAAASGGVPVGSVDQAIDRAAEAGLILRPEPRIRREPGSFPVRSEPYEGFLTSSVFTLQWHITQACDLHCKHCYDRSTIAPLELDRACRVLDDLRLFCRSRFVNGQVSFTGGNPLLHPSLRDLYRAAAERGFSTAVLGNPAPRERIEELLAIQPLNFFQVSLEGLEGHNDHIRGAGHFRRVMTFLEDLRELGVSSTVMLTLTRDNMDQVLPLAELLRDRTDLFTFNRLSLVGEGANLRPADKDRYAAFLEAYLDAARSNPVMGLKDNLINIILRKQGREPFGGCAGCGCGAAFNFITVLPDGEAHACRKFPSPIGNVVLEGIGGVYESEAARRYREGSAACCSCDLKPLCGGCQAVTSSLGRDPLTERDPYCFIDP